MSLLSLDISGIKLKSRLTNKGVNFLMSKMLGTRFLNVDLDIRAKYGLEELLEAFGSKVIDLKCQNEGCLSLEAAEQSQSVDGAILEFFNIICALPPKERSIWDVCEKRSMNIGIQAGTFPYSENFCLSSETIKILSSMNVEIIFTVYAADLSKD